MDTKAVASLGACRIESHHAALRVSAGPASKADGSCYESALTAIGSGCDGFGSRHGQCYCYIVTIAMGHKRGFKPRTAFKLFL